MEIATNILIYAWIGWAVLMLPTVAVLSLTSWGIAHIGNVILTNLRAIYRYECIKYYFEKLEKEGNHVFKKEVNQQPAGQE